MNFVPYLQERTPLGQLIQPQQSASSKSQFASPKIIENKKDNFLDMTLQEKIELMALKKRANPIRNTTSQNVRKTSDNARFKIINQIKFSKRNPVKFTTNQSFVPISPSYAS